MVEMTLVRGLPVAAASGLARAEGSLFVVADDENTLYVLREEGPPTRLAYGPAGTKRKEHKKDVECVVVAGNELAALGSGSTPARSMAFVWRLRAGVPQGPPRSLDLAPLYGNLAERIPDLNVEGAVFTGSTLRLVQRGNGPGGMNAVVDLAWAGSFETTLRAGSVARVEQHELGSVAGVRYSFTDAVAADGEFLFTAVAEAADSTYHDGPCVGAAVGILGRELQPLTPPAKVEGIEVTSVAETHFDVLLVVDDDDPASRSRLLAARLQRP